MKYKITNKTESYLKYAKIVFAPKETKILKIDKPYHHESFDIEELGKVEKKVKKVKEIKKIKKIKRRKIKHGTSL